MAIDYSIAAINARLEGVVDVIGAAGNGIFLLKAGSTTVSTISLANPCGTVSGGVLTFSGTLLDPSATGSADPIDNGVITTAAGTTVVSGLTVGVSPGAYDIQIANGINSTVIAAGQVVQVVSAQITGS